MDFFTVWEPDAPREAAKEMAERFPGQKDASAPWMAILLAERLVRKTERLKNGIALAAPQVGENVNVCVVRNVTGDTLHGVGHGGWIHIADLATGLFDHPDTEDRIFTIPNFPKRKVSFPVAAHVEVSCTFLNKANRGQEFSGRVSGLMAFPFQVLGAILRGDAFTTVEADTETIRTEAKIGPNHPCPCGSGRKHKKCCGG